MDPVSVSIGVLFKAPQLAKAVGGLLGIVESIDDKFEKLLSSDFNAGIRHLDELKLAKKEHDFLLKQAWSRFSVAVTHEEGERKALSYLALSFCQYRLGEKEVALRTLSELSSFDYVDKGARFTRAAIIASPIFPFLTISSIVSLSAARSSENTKKSFLKWWGSIPSEQRVNELKEQATEFLTEENR